MKKIDIVKYVIIVISLAVSVICISNLIEVHKEIEEYANGNWTYMENQHMHDLKNKRITLYSFDDSDTSIMVNDWEIISKKIVVEDFRSIQSNREYFTGIDHLIGIKNTIVLRYVGVLLNSEEYEVAKVILNKISQFKKLDPYDVEIITKCKSYLEGEKNNIVQELIENYNMEFEYLK